MQKIIFFRKYINKINIVTLIKNACNSKKFIKSFFSLF